MGPRKLDVGCGPLDTAKRHRYLRYTLDPDEYLGVDRVRLAGVAVVADLDRGLPFAAASVDEIVAVHLLEHVVSLEHTMREFHRILKPGGSLRAWVPHCFSAIAFGDTTHQRFFAHDSLSQFDRRHPTGYYYDFHFEFAESKMQVFRRWYRPKPFDRLLEYLINRNQPRGQRFLKVLPYKEWEIYFHLRKPTESSVRAAAGGDLPHVNDRGALHHP
jgi:predicted SAM-dependent methyltransferase